MRCDITGVSWSLHTWHQCLLAAFNMRRRTILQCLLKDFGSVSSEVLTDLFVCEVLPSMFDVLVGSKVILVYKAFCVVLNFV